jgi:hypothetical protein
MQEQIIAAYGRNSISLKTSYQNANLPTIILYFSQTILAIHKNQT